MLSDFESGEAAREQVARILRSETLRQSETLKRLFAYLAEKSLSGEAAQLKEYSIGVDVFGKPANYEPQRDASVRIQAGKLRQKLEEYYRKEGQNDPILIDFPKGHFELRFSPNTTPAPAPPQRVWNPPTLALAGLWLLTIAGFLAYVARQSRDMTAEQRAIWAPLVEADRPVLLCLGTPLFVKDSRGFFRSPRVNRWEEVLQAPDLEWLRPQLLAEKAVPVHIYTGVGDAMAAVEVARLLSAAGARFNVRRSSAVSWEELLHNHIVFLGPPKYTPRLNEIPVRLDLVMEGRRIHNLRPRDGEPEWLEGNWPETSSHVVDDYAMISRVPGVHGRSRYLILSASSTEGTAAAALYVTDPKFASELTQRLSGGTGRLPEFFQAVIHARFREMVPVEIRYLFHRTLRMEPQPGAPAGK